jgi:hypothetical protein
VIARRRLLAALAAALIAAACSTQAPPRTGRSDGATVAPVRGVYGHDSSYDPVRASATGFSMMRAAGFGVVEVDAYRESLDALLPAGLEGMVWLGAYDSGTCTFEHDDAWVRQHVSAIAGHPAIYAYYIADEPRVGRCPRAPDQLRARTGLLHRLDRRARTFTVIQDWDPDLGAVPYSLWAGSDAVDIWGFDVYPCKRQPHRCDFQNIDDNRGAIERLGFAPYLALMQDFQDCYYGLPTNAELRTQFTHWQTSHMAGYLVFSWNYTSRVPGCAQYAVQLEQAPGNVQELACENTLGIGPNAVGTSCPNPPRTNGP